jgi:hypothetical protein
VLVEARVVGRPAAAVEPREIAYAPPAPVALRSLIAHVVREEVGAFADRDGQRRFVRVLSPDDIREGVTAGKVDPGGRPAAALVDLEQAVRTALQAFEDGLYYVFVDDRQVEDLDAAVAVRSETRIRFLRLVALAGG